MVWYQDETDLWIVQEKVWRFQTVDWFACIILLHAIQGHLVIIIRAWNQVTPLLRQTEVRHDGHLADLQPDRQVRNRRIERKPNISLQLKRWLGRVITKALQDQEVTLTFNCGFVREHWWHSIRSIKRRTNLQYLGRPTVQCVCTWPSETSDENYIWYRMLPVIQYRKSARNSWFIHYDYIE